MKLLHNCFCLMKEVVKIMGVWNVCDTRRTQLIVFQRKAGGTLFDVITKFYLIICGLFGVLDFLYHNVVFAQTCLAFGTIGER